MSINKHSTSKQALACQWRPWCQWPTARWRCRVETESPVVICRIETENTVEIENPDMFKETWADQLGVNDPPTIVDAVGTSIIAQGTSGRSDNDQGTNDDADAPFTDICI